MTENSSFISNASCVGKVLFAVGAGKDMTKLEIRERTGLSMTTVISSVDELVKRGLVTFEEVKGARGGKMRSVINVHPERRVYGVSYKSGVLTGVSVDLKGEIREIVSQEPPEEISPACVVRSVLNALREKAPPPSAVALALNCEGKEGVLKGIEDAYSVPTLSLTNTEAVACLSLWRGAPLPVAALGVGARVKCAVIGRERRAIEIGTLPSPALITGEGSYDSALSADQVEETLRSSHYRGKLLIEGGHVGEVRDIADYSRALAHILATLADTVHLLLAPARILLFGEYLSEAFFYRVKEGAKGDLVYLHPEKEDFALGAALLALREIVFS